MSEEKYFSDKTPTPKKPRRRKVIIEEEFDDQNDERIGRQLKDIYEDDEGHLPNMREIKRASGGSFIAGMFKFFFTVALLAALAWAGIFFFPNAGKFDDSQVDLSIEGAENFTIGATSTYNIRFKNKQGVNLNNVTLSINYPEGFSYLTSSLEPQNMGKNQWEIGTLQPHEEKTLQITGQTYGSIGNAVSWRALLNFTPDNFKSEMQKIATLDVKPDQAPISVTLSGLDKIAVGTPSSYTVAITSQDNLSDKNLVVTPVFPTNFVLTTSSLPFEKNAWSIKASSSTSSTINQYSISFSGQFNDTSADASDLKVQVSLSDQKAQTNYLLAESTLKTELVKNAVIINTAINGSLTDFDGKPGDILNFTIAVKNAGKEDISKAKIQLVIDSPSFKKQSVLNWPEIADKHDGDINGSQISDSVRRATLVWDSSKHGDLNLIKSAGQTNLEFQLPIKNTDQAPWSSIDNNHITITTTLTYTDKTGATQTISGNAIVISLNSDLAFKQKNEITSDNKENAQHDITWILSNTFHTLKNVTVNADLFGDITFKGGSATPAGTLAFDPATKHLSWSIPEITENSDVLALPFSVIINKKNPTQNTLVSKVHIRAEDSVTGKQLELTGDEISINN